MPSDTRERMIEAAAESFRRRGMAGTSFTDVLAASGAARGAIYHHFPDGKAQLAREAVSWFGAGVTARLAVLGEADDDELATPEQVMERFLAAVRPVVGESAECASCPVAAVTLESTRGEGHLLAAADDAFAAWAAELARLLTRAGLAPDEALALGTLMVTTLEGAQVLCRAAGSLEPFDRAAAALRLTARDR